MAQVRVLLHVYVEVLSEGGGLLGRVRVHAAVALHLHKVLVVVREVLTVRRHGGEWTEREERDGCIGEWSVRGKRRVNSALGSESCACLKAK